MITKSNPVIATAADPKNDGFEYNKDAATMQCPACELAMRLEKRTGKYDNQVWSYYFSKKKCAKCPLVGSCKVGLSKTKTYNVTITSERNQKRLEFQKSEYFAERLKIRYRIEEKNGELKQAHGLRTAESMSLEAMRLQMFFTAFAVNIKRMVKLMERKTA